MAFAHGKDSRVLMNEISMSTQLNGWQASWKKNLADSTCLSDSGYRGNPGLVEGTLSFDGYFDNAALVADKPLVNEIGTNVGVDNGLNATIWPAGGTIGNPAIFCPGDISDYEVEAQVDDNVKVKAEVTADGGVDMGYVQADLGTRTTSQNHTSVDNTVSSANGGAAMLHVTDASGTGPSLIVKIQHSTDNSTWADLITFTTVTTTETSEFKTSTAGGTVNRYVRAISTIAGTSPSYTYGVSFARR